MILIPVHSGQFLKQKYGSFWSIVLQSCGEIIPQWENWRLIYLNSKDFKLITTNLQSLHIRSLYCGETQKSDSKNIAWTNCPITPSFMFYKMKFSLFRPRWSFRVLNPWLTGALNSVFFLLKFYWLERKILLKCCNNLLISKSLQQHRLTLVGKAPETFQNAWIAMPDFFH